MHLVIEVDFCTAFFCNLELPVGWLVFCSTIVWHIIQMFELGWLFTVSVIREKLNNSK